MLHSLYGQWCVAMSQQFALCIFLLLLVTSPSGDAFKIYYPKNDLTDVSKRVSGGVSQSSTCILENCLDKYGAEFEACMTTCMGGGGQSPSAGQLTTPAFKRQIDPLQSCIEAKCAGTLGRSHYGNCVFSRCIIGMRLKNFKKKRSWNDVMQTCIEFHCGHNDPDSWLYTVCVQSNCSKIAYGKR